MTKRKIVGHQECLRVFGSKFKITVRENISFWKNQEPEIARARSAAFSLILADLKEAAEECEIPLQDIGIEDFDIPMK